MNKIFYKNFLLFIFPRIIFNVLENNENYFIIIRTGDCYKINKKYIKECIEKEIGEIENIKGIEFISNEIATSNESENSDEIENSDESENVNEISIGNEVAISNEDFIDISKETGKKMKFIFGILSLPKNIKIKNNLLEIKDSFNRTYFYTDGGKLENVKFE